MKFFACFGMFVSALAISSAQGFNLDFDVDGGGPLVGQGVPSSTFAGAGNQAGFWNDYSVTGSHTQQLFGLDGQPTNVTMRKLGIGGGIGGGSGWNINSGEYRLLLNDYMRIPDEVTYRFDGLIPGSYRVITYGVDAAEAVRIAEVSITGSLTSNPQLTGQGLMPGDMFVLGVTHCIHEVHLTGSTMDITARNHVSGPPDASLNGFQIVPVPEPNSLILLTVGILALVRRRRSS